ncbi:MAG: hypothetical protein KF861_13285 [Planctomycetaceae bacterium]|nr:hypothetical protein [Planctomycetaceae bacterium]
MRRRPELRLCRALLTRGEASSREPSLAQPVSIDGVVRGPVRAAGESAHVRSVATLARLVCVLLVFVFLSGCAATSWFSPAAPFSSRAPCVLSPNADKEAIVQHVNRNIQGTQTSTGLASWQANAHLRMNSQGPSMEVPARIAVQAPRNFRLRVSMPLHGELADMGSNEREFWFWAKYSPYPNVITASHEDMLLTQQRLSVPIQPEWMMEVLGVIPIDSENVTLRRGGPNTSVVDLVSDHVAPDGGQFQKVVRVDACHGIIREHALYDGRGVLIASARLGDHRIDEATGLITPRVIRLDWPSMQQQITMRFDNIEVNPRSIPAAVWQVPERPECPRLELSALLNASHGNGLNPFGPTQNAGLTPAGAGMSEEFGPGQPTGSVSVGTAGAAPPSTYSAGASRSSSDRRPRARGLWPWQRR